MRHDPCVGIDLAQPLPGVGWQAAEDAAEHGVVRRVGRARIGTLHLPLPTDHDAHIRCRVIPVSAAEPAPVALMANGQDVRLEPRRNVDGSLTLEGTIPKAALASGRRLSEIVFRFGAESVALSSIEIHQAQSQRPWRRILSRAGMDCRCPPRTAHHVASEAAPRAPARDGPFLIILARPSAGLFSLFVHVLRCLVATPEMISIVYYGKGSYTYWRDEGWNGALNGWEYYFHPVSDYALDELLHVEPRQLAGMSNRDIERRLETSSFVVTSWWRKFAYKRRHNKGLLAAHNASGFGELYGRLIAERIRVKDHVLAEVDEFWDRHLAAAVQPAPRTSRRRPREESPRGQAQDVNETMIRWPGRRYEDAIAPFLAAPSLELIRFTDYLEIVGYL